MEKPPPKKRRAAAVTTGVNPENLRSQGLRTRNAIIRVARKMLLEGGSLEFSLRAVAQGAKISISNLQYYFPNRLAMVRAVVEPVAEIYLNDVKEAISGHATPGDLLSSFLERPLHDAKHSKEIALWWHFVSIASTDAECSQLLDGWYKTLGEHIAQLIREVNPKLKEDLCLPMASVIVALVEGSGLLLGAGRSTRVDIPGYEAQLKRAVELLICSMSLWHCFLSVIFPQNARFLRAFSVWRHCGFLG